ncbi:MAG: insulinase family protein [Gammaproteobacteria bacterium]|nr:insulinase family protein [Gammaproteobacteria bacterium]
MKTREATTVSHITAIHNRLRSGITKIVWIPVASAAVACLVACQTLWQDPQQPIKSPNDEREYRYIELPNKLRALLIHAPDSDKSAAAVSVARGSDHDPDAHPGLAHFVEHMLFIATEKYPEVNAYHEFIEKHGGWWNGYTDSHHTTYYFDIKPDRFAEALDRIAQFFIAPLFDPDYVEREKNAVHSEYQLQVKQDGWRGYAVYQQLMNPVHPGSRFDIGSIDTLKDAGIKDVRSFFETNYSADTTTVAVLGADDLDSLEVLVRERFSAMANRNLGPIPANPPSFTPGSLPANYAWQTLENTKSLQISFPVPPLEPHYRSKPTAYLGHLIHHEGPDSLYDVLHRRGWIKSLTAGGSSLDSENASFDISIGLTDKGRPHTDEISGLVYAWIDKIRDDGIAAWRYREIAYMYRIAFRFQERGSPVGTVVSAAEALVHYPPEDLLRAGYLMESFDETLIRGYLDRLVPENSLVSFSGPDVEGDLLEPMFDVRYRVGPGIAPVEVEAPFVLPEPNPYLPEDLELAIQPGPLAPPVRIQTDSQIELWHAPDTEFRTPRASVGLRLWPARALESPADSALNALYGRLVRQALNARAYASQMAGIGYRFRSTWSGFDLAAWGYHDNLDILFDEILAAFADTPIDPELFAVARTEQIKTYVNMRFRHPYVQVANAIGQTLHPDIWDWEVLLEAARNATPESLEAWRREMVRGVRATLFVHGNLTEPDARNLAAIAARHLAVSNAAPDLSVATVLEGARRIEREVDHDDAVYLLYLQGDGPTFGERARLGLLGRMLGPRYFKALRTEQQRGYVVQAYRHSVERHPGIVFVVQSPGTDAAGLEAATTAFIEAQREWLREIPPEELEDHKRGYIAALTRRDQNLMDRFSRLRGDLHDRVLTFDSAKRLADAVAVLDATTLSLAYERLIDPATGNRLTIFSRGGFDSAPAADQTVTDESTAEFRMSSRDVE